MECGQLVLLDRLDGHRLDIPVTVGLQQGPGVRAVGFVPTDVGADVLRGQKHDRVTELSELSAPVVGRAAGFEHDGGRVPLGEEAEKARAGEPVALREVPGTGGDGYFEDGLGCTTRL